MSSYFGNAEFSPSHFSPVAGTFATVVASTGNLYVQVRKKKQKKNKKKTKVNESDRGDDGPSEDPGGLGSHAGAPGVCPGRNSWKR